MREKLAGEIGTIVKGKLLQGGAKKIIEGGIVKSSAVNLQGPEIGIGRHQQRPQQIN